MMPELDSPGRGRGRGGRGIDNVLPVPEVGNRSVSVQVTKPAFDWTRIDKYTEWKCFRRECESLFMGTYRQVPQIERGGIIINWLSRPGMEIAAAWTQVEKDLNYATDEAMYTAFEKRFKPAKNEILSSFQFRQFRRKKGQNTNEFMAALRNKVRECDYGDAQDRMVKEQFITHIEDTVMQDKLLEDVTLETTLEDCLNITRQIEAMRLQKGSMNGKDQKSFDAIRGRKTYRDNSQYRNNSNNRSQSKGKYRHNSSQRSQSRGRKDNCGYCGYKHAPRQCPAYGKECKNCHRKNHFAKVCRQGKSQSNLKARKSQHDSVETETEDDFNDWSSVVSISSVTTKKVTEVKTFDSISDPFVLKRNDFARPGQRKRLMGCISTANKRLRKSVNYKIDTGADSNLLSVKTFRKLFPDVTNAQLESTKDTSVFLEAANGSEIEQLGKCKLSLCFRGKVCICIFYVVPGVTSLLGLPDTEHLGLIKTFCRPVNLTNTDSPNQSHNPCIDSVQVDTKVNTHTDSATFIEKNHDISAYFVEDPDYDNDMRDSHKFTKHIMTKYKDCFQGIGCFRGTVHIDLKKDAVPHQAPPRRVAQALQQPLKEELDRLTKEDILIPLAADERSEWCNSFVCVPKSNGSVRLCIDPAQLNQAIIRPVHRGKTMQDILPTLAGARYFSILDAKSGFWNLQLDEESSHLTTFSTMYGRFRFCRLPFGLSCAGDLFQRKIDEVLLGLKNLENIADDILVVGYKEDGSDHDEAVEALLKRAREYNLKFGPEKCKLRVTAVPFFGEMASRKGIKPDPKKLEGISKMRIPKDKIQLQSFLGCLNFMSKFSPELSVLVKPLRQLTSANAEFVWTPNHTDVFEKAKRIIKKDCALQYYRPEKKLYIESDASKIGLGAALLQIDPKIQMDYDMEIPPTECLRPIAYGSKSLTTTEQNYSNIEREALGILHALQKFHHYTFGRHTHIITDHRPLLAIFKKDVATASPRLQRILMKMHQYNISLSYRPGPEMHLADCLSRVGHIADTEEEIPGMKITVDSVCTIDEIKVLSANEIRDKTLEDDKLQKVVEYVLNGWPEHVSEIHDESIRQYFNFRDEIGIVNGILVKGQRLIIPTELRNVILKALHTHHLGIEKTRNLARTTVYWPGLNKEILEMIEQCTTCNERHDTQKRCNLQPHDIPPCAWHTLGTDVFYYHGDKYLLIVDYYSKFPIVKKLNNESSSHIISTFKEVFAEYGIPEKIVSDSGSNLTSQEFKAFASALDVKTVASSPYHHQSNGQAENAVKQIKNLMKKCDDANEDIHNALLLLRSTPITGCNSSPAELLQGRRLKSFLPRIEMSRQNDEQLRSLQSKQENMKKYHDWKHGMKEPKEYYIGQPIMVQKEDQGPWTHGVIVARNTADHNNRSYKVKITMTDRIITRNEKHIRASKIPTSTYEKRKSTDIPTYVPSMSKPTINKPDLSKRTLAEKSTLTLSIPQGPSVSPKKSINKNVPVVPTESLVKTRYGRTIKPPVKLTL